MKAPVRMQLRRTRGYRLQETSQAINGLPAVKVDRTGKWGNPFRIGVTVIDGKGTDRTEKKIETAEDAVEAFETMLRNEERNFPSKEEIVEELSGKNLACWCKLGYACHGETLLRSANGGDDD